MSVLKSKTITATEIRKTAMSLNHQTMADGIDYVTWAQGYEFVDENGNPVTDLQKHSTVNGQISIEELQTALPDIYNALLAIWDFLDSEIRKQEELQ